MLRYKENILPILQLSCEQTGLHYTSNENTTTVLLLIYIIVIIMTAIQINIPKAEDIDENFFYRVVLFENLPTIGSNIMPTLDTATQYENWKTIPHGVDSDNTTPLTLADATWKILKKKHQTPFPGIEFNLDNAKMPILVLREKNYWPIIVQIKSWRASTLNTGDIEEFVSILTSHLAQFRLCLKNWNEKNLGTWNTTDPSTVKIFGFVFSSDVASKLSDDFMNGIYGKYPRFVTLPEFDHILTSGNNRTRQLGAEKSPWNLKIGNTILDVDSNFWRDPSTDITNLQSNGPNLDYEQRGTFYNSNVTRNDHPSMGNEPFFLTKVHTDMEANDAMFASKHYIYIGGFHSPIGKLLPNAKSIICHEMMHTFFGVFDTYRIGNCSAFVTTSEQAACENRRWLMQGRNGPEWYATFPSDKTILHYSKSLTAFDVAYIRMQYKRQVDKYIRNTIISGRKACMKISKIDDKYGHYDTILVIIVFVIIAYLTYISKKGR